MYFYYVCTVHFWNSYDRHVTPSQTNTIYTVYTYTCTHSYQVYQQINNLPLAISSGMKIIFQPSCFHTLKIFCFVRKQMKRGHKKKKKQPWQINRPYVSQLLLANKLILYQGNLVWSFFKGHGSGGEPRLYRELLCSEFVTFEHEMLLSCRSLHWSYI